MIEAGYTDDFILAQFSITAEELAALHVHHAKKETKDVNHPTQ